MSQQRRDVHHLTSSCSCPLVQPFLFFTNCDMFDVANECGGHACWKYSELQSQLARPGRENANAMPEMRQASEIPLITNIGCRVEAAYKSEGLTHSIMVCKIGVTHTSPTSEHISLFNWLLSHDSAITIIHRDNKSLRISATQVLQQNDRGPKCYMLRCKELNVLGYLMGKKPLPKTLRSHSQLLCSARGASTSGVLAGDEWEFLGVQASQAIGDNASSTAP
eukprot:1138446-Pelagomonas_calceolata.AAC.5